MEDMELDISGFELMETPKECVLKDTLAWTVEGKDVFQTAEGDRGKICVIDRL